MTSCSAKISTGRHVSRQANHVRNLEREKLSRTFNKWLYWISGGNKTQNAKSLLLKLDLHHIWKAQTHTQTHRRRSQWAELTPGCGLLCQLHVGSKRLFLQPLKTVWLPATCRCCFLFVWPRQPSFLSANIHLLPLTFLSRLRLKKGKYWKMSFLKKMTQIQKLKHWDAEVNISI